MKEDTAIPRALTRETLRAATRALAARDPDLARVLDRFGEPPLWGRRPGYASLVRIILEQQVSLAAARTMYRRVERRAGGVTPGRIAALGPGGLREIGLTRQKAAYCHGLAVRLLEGSLDLAAVAGAPDDAGRSRLLEIPGLGPWSVDIYYLMALRRPDVWPRGDMGLADAMREVKRLRSLPSIARQERIARRWSPWRSVAARLLWHHYLGIRGQIHQPARPERPTQRAPRPSVVTVRAGGNRGAPLA